MTKRAWILVADGSRARLFAADKPASEIKELEAWEAPTVRMHETELTSDLPGRAFDSTNPARHAYGQPEDPKQAEMRRFAKMLAERLEEAAKRDAYERLYLAAGPKMLGLLREALGEHASKRLAGTYDRDWTRERADTIRARLPEYL